jgi:hypothetical protein
MNKKLDALNMKIFHVFPSKKTCIPGHIILDTKTLVGLLNLNLTNINKKLTTSVCYKNYSKIINQLWSKVFNMEKSIFKNKEKENNITYIFNHMIQTDGYSCSLIFVRSECKKIGTKKSNMILSNTIAKLANPNLNDSEEIKYGNEFESHISGNSETNVNTESDSLIKEDVILEQNESDNPKRGRKPKNNDGLNKQNFSPTKPLAEIKILSNKNDEINTISK